MNNKPNGKTRWRWIKRLTLAAIGLAGCLVMVVSWVVAGRLVAPHQRKIPPAPPELHATDVTITTSRGSKVAAWHCDLENDLGVVVLVHGIGASRTIMIDRALMLRRAGYSTLLIDLQAHGESDGDRVTLGHREKDDVVAAVDFARQQHAGQPLAVIGVSLGGAAAVLAAPLQVDAMAIESVFPDIERAIGNRVAHVFGSWALVPKHLLLWQIWPRLGVSTTELEPIGKMPVLGCPVLVMSGTEDRDTPPAETRQLFAAAKQPKELWLVRGAAHVDLFAAEPIEYQARLLRFLASSFSPDQHEDWLPAAPLMTITLF